MSYGPTIELGPQPRVLESYPMATPPPMSGANVNPFWSTQARAHPGESGVVPEEMPQGEVRRSPNYVDVEAIREKVLREAENPLQRRSRRPLVEQSHHPSSRCQVLTESLGGQRSG